MAKKNENNETISMRVTIRGNKNIWTDFVNKVRKRKKDTKQNVWGVLEGLIEEWLKKVG